MRNKMKKLSIIALAVSAAAIAAVAILKLFGKKSSCQYSDDDFDDDFDDNYDFETDCCADDELEVVIPAEENDETVEVKVEEKNSEDETTTVEIEKEEDTTDDSDSTEIK